MNIYEIDQTINALLRESVDSQTGELSESAAKELEALELSMQEKQKNIILYFKNLQGEESILDAEIARLKRLKEIVANKQSSLKGLLEDSMRLSSAKELDFTTCKAKFKKNPPKLVISKDADVSAYTVTKLVESVDKKAIKADIKAGKEVAGCEVVQEERLDIQ